MRPSTPRVQRGVTGTLTAIAVACTGGVADRVLRGSPCTVVLTIPAAEPTRAEPAEAGLPAATIAPAKPAAAIRPLSKLGSTSARRRGLWTLPSPARPAASSSPSRSTHRRPLLMVPLPPAPEIHIPAHN